jgi:hypothetical protein
MRIGQAKFKTIGPPTIISTGTLALEDIYPVGHSKVSIKKDPAYKTGSRKILAPRDGFKSRLRRDLGFASTGITF